MKKIALLPVLLAAAGMMFLAAAPQAQVIEEIVAQVNNDIITLSEVRTQFQVQIQQLKSMNLPQDQYDKQYQVIKKDLLNAMILDILLLQKAKELDLNVAEQLKGNLQKIKQDNNFTSDDDLRRAIEQSGMPYDQWLKQFEDRLRREGVLYMDVDRSIVLDDSEIVNYYKLHPQEFTVPTEFGLHAVYLASAGKNPEALAAQKQEIDAKLKAGTPFDDVAATLSDSPVKELKGDLKTVKKGEIDKTLEQAVEKMKTGDISPWVEAKNGWYLIKLVDKKESRLQTFTEVKDQVQQRLYGEKRQKKMDEYMTQLKERSYVRILKPNPLDY